MSTITQCMEEWNSRDMLCTQMCIDPKANEKVQKEEIKRFETHVIFRCATMKWGTHVIAMTSVFYRQ